LASTAPATAATPPLLITQTDRFKAAINISGKVDMVSFYTDSPRLGVRNIHAPEKSQDRIGGTLWEYPERYLEHSAILQADRHVFGGLADQGHLEVVDCSGSVQRNGADDAPPH
jgi:hypothetical protein